MLRQFVASLVAASVAFAPGASAGPYFFRYSLSHAPGQAIPDPEIELGNDVDAYYVTPVGVDFSKRIPVATTAVADWRLDTGVLPEGIFLDSETGVLSGRGRVEGERKLSYRGYDRGGNLIARARISFNVFTPVGVGTALDLYARKGKYFYSEIPLPKGVSVHRWDAVSSAPPGMTMLGSAINGSPTMEGVFDLAWRGFDYLGREVAYAYGTLLVEDGVVAETVPDQSISLAKNESFDLQPVVRRSVGKLSYKLVAESPRPQGLAFAATTGRITGAFPTHDTSASFHYVITDGGDGSVGRTNTFVLSTRPAELSLANVPDIVAYVNKPMSVSFEVKDILPGAKWEVSSGSLPDGIVIDAETGTISGKPVRKQASEGVVVRISGPGMATTESRPFKFSVLPEQLVAKAAPLVARTGMSFETRPPEITSGLVAPVEYELAPGSSLSPEMSLDTRTGIIRSSGAANAAVLSASLVATNGDGQKSPPFVQEITILNPLAVSYESVAVRRLEELSSLASLPDDSISGTASFKLESGSLPGWGELDPQTGAIKGRPVAAGSEGVYGPFVVSVADATGERAQSSPFSITVSPRADIEISSGITDIQRFVPNDFQAVAVKNAYSSHGVALSSGTLPSTLSMSSSGRITGSTTDPVGTEYQGLIATVTDADGQTRASAPFTLKVVEPGALEPLAGTLDIARKWTAGVPVSIRLPSLSNGFGKLSYSLGEGDSGFVLDVANPDFPAVRATMPSAGRFSIAFTIKDETARPPANGKLTLEVLDPMILAMPEVLEANRGSRADFVPASVNQIGLVSHVLSGSLPRGLTFDKATGAIRGTPSEEGDFPLFVTATDEAGTSSTAGTTLRVGPPLPFTFRYTAGRMTYRTSSQLPARATPSSNLGSVDYRFVSGRLPRGVDFIEGRDGASGFVGVPMEVGRYSATIRGTDLGLLPTTVDDRSFEGVAKFEVTYPSDSPIEMNDQTFKVRAGAPFSVTPTVAKVIPPLNYTATSPGGLGNNLVLSPSTGALSGTLPAPGVYPGNGVSLTDDMDRTAQARHTLEAIGELSVSTPSSTSFNQFADGTATITLKNLIGRATFGLADDSSPLPEGMSVDAASGAIKGAPEATGTFAGIRVAATDSFDGMTRKSSPFTLQVSPRKPLTIAAPQALALKRFETVAASVTASDAVGPVRFTVEPPLPAGIILDPSTGAFSGSSSGLHEPSTHVVTAVDAKGGAAGTAQASVTVSVAERDPLRLVAGSPMTFKQHADGEFRIEAVDGIGPLAWTISPPLPSGLTLKDGVIAGTPSAASPAATFHVSVQDGKGGELGTSGVDVQLGVSAREPLGIETAASSGFNQHFEGRVSLVASNVIGNATWSIHPDLPSWASFSEGVISGVPDAVMPASSYSVTVQDEHDSFTMPLTLEVQSRLPLGITSPATLTALLGYDLSSQIETENAVGTLSWSLSGNLPAGLVFDRDSGRISGKPEQFGIFPGIVVSVSDEKGGLASRTLTVDVKQDGSPITMSAAPVSTHVDTAMQTSRPTIENAVGKVTYGATGLAGTSLVVDRNTGVVSGAIPAAGLKTIIITATDETQRSASASLAIEVLPPISLTVPSFVLLYNTEPSPGSQAAAVNAVGPSTWSLKSGRLPRGLYVDSATGRLAGKAKELGSFGPLTLGITDSLGGTAISGSTTVRVDMNGDPIALEVSDLSVHVGQAVRTAAPVVDNELGITTFFSTDVAAQGLSIDPATGIVSGPSGALKDVYVNVSVRDSMTKRVTSKPLRIQVVPNVSAAYPTLKRLEQYADTASYLPQTAYVLGKASFEKADPSIWPAGIDVDPLTGAISGVPGKSGTFAGLKVRITDTSGGATKNSAESNSFTIEVVKSPAAPDIQDIVGDKLFTVGQAIADVVPETRNQIDGKPWAFGGLTYSLSGPALPAGLTFDPVTGTIAGTPTATSVYLTYSIRVTDADGAVDDMKPFRIGIASAEAFQPTPEQKTVYTFETEEKFSTTPVTFDNAVGNVTLSFAGNSGITNFDTTTAVSKGPFDAPATFSVAVTATDALGRKATFTYALEITQGMIVTMPAQVMTTGRNYLVLDNDVDRTPSVKNAKGDVSFTYVGLPSGVTATARGTLQGQPAATGAYSVTVTAEDLSTGKKKSSTFSLTVAATVTSTAPVQSTLQGARRYWYLSWIGNVAGERLYAGSGNGARRNITIKDVRFYPVGGTSYFRPTRTFSHANGWDGTSANISDQNPSTLTQDYTGSSVIADFGIPVMIGRIEIDMVGGTGNDLYETTLGRSDDPTWSGTGIFKESQYQLPYFYLKQQRSNFSAGQTVVITNTIRN